MFRILSADDAIALVRDGDCIGVNSFLALANPDELQAAVYRRFAATGHPGGLEIFCPSGFGGWDENLFADRYVAAGAVRRVVASHFMSTPAVLRMARENQIECYCLPLGALSHSLRAAAAGRSGLLEKVGLNIFVDPRLGGPGVNECSKDESLVRVVQMEGEEYLWYKAPKIDVAFIKGTTVDPSGNISFENECVTVDALSLAQAAKQNGGKVIVQVERVSHVFARPRNVIVPGVLVDAVVVCDRAPAVQQYSPILSGDIHVPSTQMDYWMSQLTVSGKRGGSADQSAEIIGERAARELHPGDIVNVGIGIPEKVGKYASSLGILKDLTLTVEAGGIGGLPAPGVAFGATIGADMVCDTATQFDFYDGGGLDICFMGGIEADRHGNVNAHKLGDRYAGVGGFANITGATRTVVFCMNFTTKGLEVSQEGGRVKIEREGQIPKFKKQIAAVSFSAKNALQRGQRVLYVTERCVFELTKGGLRLAEVFPGVDEKAQVRDLLDFALVD